MPFNDLEIAQVVINSDASVVDQDVEGVDRVDGPRICETLAIARTAIPSVTRVWVGWALTALAVLFLIFDGVTKLTMIPQIV